MSPTVPPDVSETTRPTPAVFVIGAGAVGSALATRLARAAVPVLGIHARRAEAAETASALSGVLGTWGPYPSILQQADVVILAVRDDAIAAVAGELAHGGFLRPSQVLLHCSGALPSGIALAPARGRVRGLGTLHPLLSFADAKSAAAALAGAAVTFEVDAAGRDAACAIVRALGASEI
jgi:predicted short-subunit dehydrogenase-like oxidoreductase (DUF2520 family)